MIANGHAFGALMLHSGEPRFFENEEEIGLLGTLAADLSFAIESAKQEQERQRNGGGPARERGTFPIYMDNSPTFVFMNDEGGRVLYLNSRNGAILRDGAGQLAGQVHVGFSSR